MVYPADYINQILQGDCLEIMKGIPDNSVDLILTDPPYGVGKGDWDNFLGLEWFDVCRIKAKTVAFTCGHKFMYRYPEPDCILAVVRLGSIQLQKKGGGFSHWEPVLIYGEKLPNPDVIKIPANTGLGHLDHPCPKSVQLYEGLVSKMSKENDLILDPFLGSGTTAVACVNLNRRYIGIEISEDYCKIARERVETAKRQRRMF